MRRTLAERKEVHAQRKARLAEVDARFALADRKLRTRKLIEAGGLVDKAGLLGLEPNALYGALLSLKEPAANPETIEQWAAHGGRTFAREARERDEGREAIVIAFPALVPKDVGNALRKAGFRFNRILQHWEGLARYDDAEALARENGGVARRVAAAPQGGVAAGTKAAPTA